MRFDLKSLKSDLTFHSCPSISLLNLLSLTGGESLNSPKFPFLPLSLPGHPLSLYRLSLCTCICIEKTLTRENPNPNHSVCSLCLSSPLSENHCRRMSSDSSNPLRGVKCGCGERVPLRTALTEPNVGRRFLGCVNYKVS